MSPQTKDKKTPPQHKNLKAFEYDLRTCHIPFRPIKNNFKPKLLTNANKIRDSPNSKNDVYFI